MEAATRAETERWFRRRGLPHFIEGRVARHDIWTRALPFLVAVFLLQTLNAVNLEASWPVWLNTLALVGGAAITVGAWGAINRLRGRRFFELPQRIGVVELAVFVIVPPVVPLVFGGQVGSAAATLGGNVALLGVAYLATSYGVVSMSRWGLVQMGRQFGDVLGVVVRALPLLLLFVTFLFINAEAWQVTSELPWWLIAVVGALMFLIGALFAVLRVPRQIEELTEPVSQAEVAARTIGTPVEGIASPAAAPAERRRLSPRQWGNVGLVIVVSEGVQVLLVSSMIFVFFSVFGFLAVGQSVIVEWTADTPHAIWTLTLGDHQLVLTEELLKVATFLATFSGLYFTVSMLTDATYRAEFLDELVDDVRTAFAVRDVYLDGLESGAVVAAGSSTLSPT